MLEHESVRGVIESMKVVTASNSERVARFAFEFAKKNGRKKVIFHNLHDINEYQYIMQYNIYYIIWFNSNTFSPFTVMQLIQKYIKTVVRSLLFSLMWKSRKSYKNIQAIENKHSMCIVKK